MEYSTFSGQVVPILTHPKHPIIQLFIKFIILHPDSLSLKNEKNNSHPFRTGDDINAGILFSERTQIHR